MFGQTNVGARQMAYPKNCGLRMRRECRKRFPRHRLESKP